jgi:phosphonopyruvate decarboxylase
VKAVDFVQTLKEAGIQDYTGVPCSTFTEVIRYVEAHEQYIIAASEGEAMGIAAGISLSGNIPAVLMQNDGFGNAINPLTSLQKLYEFPTLLIISWRGEPGIKDAPQHVWSGRTLLDLMKVFEIEYIILEADIETQRAEILRLAELVRKEQRICAIICRKNVFEAEEQPPDQRQGLLSRKQAIEAVLTEIDDDMDIFSTTGKPSRELYSVRDRANNFYTVGSMGCTSAIAFGHWLKSGRRTVVLDGDGAILLKMGTLATIAYYQPAHMLHICLDNESYESTGAQATVTSRVDLSRVAGAAGYNEVARVTSVDDITAFIRAWKQRPTLSFLHIKVMNQTEAGLGRPKEDPVDLKKRFMEAASR